MIKVLALGVLSYYSAVSEDVFPRIGGVLLEISGHQRLVNFDAKHIGAFDYIVKTNECCPATQSIQVCDESIFQPDEHVPIGGNACHRMLRKWQACSACMEGDNITQVSLIYFIEDTHSVRWRVSSVVNFAFDANFDVVIPANQLRIYKYIDNFQIHVRSDLRLTDLSSFEDHLLSGYEGAPNKQSNRNGKNRHYPLCESVTCRNNLAVPEPPPAAWKIFAFILCGVSIALAVMVALGQVVDCLTKQDD
ncbi:hypothetical protein N8Y41_01340 [bacterium]|nr:hypothetical protein [bacterium]